MRHRLNAPHLLIVLPNHRDVRGGSVIAGEYGTDADSGILRQVSGLEESE